MQKIACFIALFSILVVSCTSDNFGGPDKSYDTTLLQLREKVAPEFKKFEFRDPETGRKMSYNLFVPKDYDTNKSYPLVVFIADASTVGKGVEAPLKQGYGGIIWATAASQQKHPCFVLVPSFSGPKNAVNDDWEATEEVDIAFRLLKSVISEFSIDANRVYATGQSMGGMISFYWNATHPELFAASLFVGSQWDVTVLKPLVEKKFFYVVSSGDEKASAGMQELASMFEKEEVAFGFLEFSAKLPSTEKEKQVQALISEGHGINFIKFTKGTVAPNGVHGGGSEHMYSFDHAYQLESIRNWLFQQTRN